MIIGEFREFFLLLSGEEIKEIRDGLILEVIVGVIKFMSNMDFICVVKKLINIVICNIIIGMLGIFLVRF